MIICISTYCAGMASSSNAKDLNAEDFDEEDDEEYVPSSDESTEFSDDDFGSDMSGVSDEMDLPEISSNDEEWSPLNEYNDKGDSEDEETGVQFIGLLEAVKEEGHNTRTCKNEKIVPPMKEKKPPGRPKNPNSEERRKRKKASETSGGKASETSGGKGKRASETRQNVGEQGVPPMQFPESQVDEGVPLTQEGVSETQDTMLETQETVPETQFKQVPVVDVALVEDGKK
ncbi:hypothetical protein L2E82_36176 [Cichorium intybus]|uniref:Uncharacterized protein n=1 Tax=Cichorium intybus TaxID=13427 RepID=A0ACB9BQX9_CICIN|nr:hypothetical protein L2E82_36176 [Cichorium intybus]